MESRYVRTSGCPGLLRRGHQGEDGASEDAFVAMRTSRDATLAAPVLLLPSIQVNMRAGKFPPASANGVRYLRIPVKFKGGAAAA